MTDTDTEELRAALAAVNPVATLDAWDKWGDACHPKRIARLLDALDEARAEARRLRDLLDKAVADPQASYNLIQQQRHAMKASP